MSDGAEDGKSIEARILERHDRLTPSEKRLARAVLSMRTQLYGMTAAELAAMADVSNATAVRCFRALGYDSFNAARLSARPQVVQGSPLHRFDSGAGPARDLAGHLRAESAALSAAAETFDPATVAAVVAILSSARRLCVVGYRNSAILAAYARALLIMVRDHVDLLPHAGMSIAEDLAGLGPPDAVLVMGFRRPPEQLDDIMAAVSDSGARLILITDLSGLASALRADLCLRCPIDSPGIFDSYVIAMSLIGFLGAETAHARGADARQRMKSIEDLHAQVDNLRAVPR